jgi:hypothetical protein
MCIGGGGGGGGYDLPTPIKLPSRPPPTEAPTRLDPDVVKTRLKSKRDLRREAALRASLPSNEQALGELNTTLPGGVSY